MVKVFNSSIMEIQMSDVREKLGGKGLKMKNFLEFFYQRFVIGKSTSTSET